VTASLVAWELGSGAMELGAEDIIIPYWGKVQLLVQKNRRVEEFGKYAYEGGQEWPCLLPSKCEHDMRVDCIGLVNRSFCEVSRRYPSLF
jgi:hypothetical protein